MPDDATHGATTLTAVTAACADGGSGSASRSRIVATVRVAARRPVRVPSRPAAKPLPRQRSNSNSSRHLDERTVTATTTTTARHDGGVAAIASAVAASKVRCFYPASLWAEQQRGRDDDDVITPQTTYTLPAHQRLEVGKYVPDPYNVDFSSPKYTPPAVVATSASGSSSSGGVATASSPVDGSAGVSLPPLRRASHTTPSRLGRARSTSSHLDNDDDVDRASSSSSSSDKEHDTCERKQPQQPQRRSSLSSRKGSGAVRQTTYSVVTPRYAASTASLYFPIPRLRLASHAHADDGGGDSVRLCDAAVDRPELQSRRAYVTIQRDNVNRMCLYKIGPYAVAFRVVVNAFEAAGMRYTASNERFNLLWAKRATPYTLASLTPYQKVNHFPGTWGIGRKDSLALNVSRMRRFFGEAAMDIAPPSFILPRQRDELLSEAERHPATPRCPLVYILKPCASSCGRGIELCKGTPPMPRGGRRLVCQRYIGNPLLIDGRKFDLRLYCVVTSFDPLRVYLFDDGLVRFAAERYTGPDSSLDNVHVHLTNYSVNKTAELRRNMSRHSHRGDAGNDGNDGDDDKDSAGDGSSVGEASPRAAAAATSTPASPRDDKCGNSKKDNNDDDNCPVDIKWSLMQLRAYLRAHHPRGDAAWRAIEEGCSDVVIKALLSIEHDVVERVRAECSDKSGRNCFELFGLDVMVDDALQVRLIEVNIMPSLATGTPLDKAVKSRMLAHLLTLVRVVPHRRDAVVRHDEASVGDDGGDGDRKEGSGADKATLSSTTTSAKGNSSSDDHNDGDGRGSVDVVDSGGSNGDRTSNHRSGGGGNAAVATMPRGAEPTRPERVYAFGHHPNGGALLHEQPLLARFHDAGNAHSMLSPAEVLMLVESDEELHCRGGFRRIFPDAATVMRYLPYFTNGVRRNTYLLVSATMMQAKKYE